MGLEYCAEDMESVMSDRGKLEWTKRRVLGMVRGLEMHAVSGLHCQGLDYVVVRPPWG